MIKRCFYDKKCAFDASNRLKLIAEALVWLVHLFVCVFFCAWYQLDAVQLIRCFKCISSKCVLFINHKISFTACSVCSFINPKKSCHCNSSERKKVRSRWERSKEREKESHILSLRLFSFQSLDFWIWPRTECTQIHFAPNAIS